MADKLTDENLITILRKEENAARNWQDAELTGSRQKALDYYDRQPMGDEEPGQSSVVTSEFADTVESVMPGLMRVFAGGEEIVEFTPMARDDERAAREATQYIPHVLMRENDGFRILYWFLKDVLMYRLATLTVDVAEVEKTQEKPVEAWTQLQMAAAHEAATENGATDIVFNVKQDATLPEQVGVAPPQAGGEPVTDLVSLGISPVGPEQLAVPTFSGTIKLTRKKKRVIVDNVAPEDLLVSPADVRDIDSASFAGFRKEVTASDLRVLGLKQDEIDSLSADRISSPEEDQRQDGQSQSQPRKDDQRRLWLVVAYVKADENGDGISEMLRVVYAHAGGTAGAIIERMEWEEGEAPITIGSAILMSHTIIGRSLFDQTQDLQEIGTVVTRAMLDNTYQVIRPRPAINNRVDVNSVLDWTPGMPIMVTSGDSPANAISWQTVTPIIEPALAVLGYLENKRDQRTGTSRMGNNMDSDALADVSQMTKGGTQMVMSAAQERQELMARTLSSTAFTRLMRHIYRAIKRAATGPVEYPGKTSDDEWRTCDPTKWPDDMHLIVAAGTGTGNKQIETQNLMGIGAAQEKVILAQGGPNGPVVTLEHVANTGRKLAETLGFRATGQFFASPKEVEIAEEEKAKNPPPPSPEMAKVQADAAAAQAKLQSDNALAQQRLSAEMQQKQQQAAIDIQLTRERAELDLQLMRDKAAAELQIRRETAALDAQLKREEIQLEAELEKYKIDNTPQPGNTQLRQQEVTS